MQPVVTTSNDATFGTQHETLTDSTQWNTGTADNNYDAAAPFNDQGPPKNDYAPNVETAVMGTNTLNDANYTDSRYTVQQQTDVQAAPLMDAQPPMMTGDVHDLQQQQEVEPQHQQPPQGQPQNYEAQTNGGGYHAELTPPNNQEPAPSGPAVEEDIAPNDQPMSSQPQAMTTDYATQPMQTQQEPEPSLNGAATEMTTTTSAMTDTPIITTTTTTTTSTMTGTTEEVKSHKVQIVTHQAGPQQAGISGSEKTEESPNYSSTRDSSTITQVANPTQAIPQQRINSWAALTQHAVRGPSPKRQPQLIARDRLNANVLPRKGQAKSSKDKNYIKAWVSAAMRERRTIWISYNGHQKPFIPRCIEPKKWDQRGNTQNSREASFFAVQYKSKSRNQQRFFLRNVLEVRSQTWRIPEAELRKLRKMYPNSQSQNQGGGGGYGGGGYGNQGQNSGQGQTNSMNEMRDRPRGGQRYGGGGNNKRYSGGNQGNNSRMATSGNMQ